MATPTLVCVVDEAPASAAVFAALAGNLAAPSLAVELAGPPESVLNLLVRTCARRGLAVERGANSITIAGRSIALVSEPRAGSSARATLREARVELQHKGATRLGERAELLAASPLLDILERGAGMRWAILSVIEGRDAWQASVDLSERGFDSSFDAALQRSFPALVGRVASTLALGPQLGAVLHLNVLLGTGASVEALRDQIADDRAPASDDPRSRWPRLRPSRSCGSADSLNDPGVLVDLDAIVSAGPLVRIAAYYDPPAILAGDLLRRLAK